RGLEGGVDLDGVVAAAVEPVEVLVGVVGDEGLELGRVEEALLELRSAEGGVTLRLAVDELLEALDQHAVLVTAQELVPGAAPGDLDHVPAGAAEDPLELLDDLAVAVDGAVEPLQVRVHDPDQVVELRARRHADRAEGLDLVGLAVADERPHLAAAL